MSEAVVHLMPFILFCPLALALWLVAKLMDKKYPGKKKLKIAWLECIGGLGLIGIWLQGGYFLLVGVPGVGIFVASLPVLMRFYNLPRNR